jgi:HAD superfamily hydrolase (TIGR01458 family)
MSSPFRWAEVRGLLIDIDGTLLANDRAIPGADDLIARLRREGLPFRLFTNTTRRSRRSIAGVLAEAGLSIDSSEILTPSLLARRVILASGRPRARLLVPEEARADFAGVVEEDDHPDWVVVGDLGGGFTFDRLNAAFLALRAGARLLALQKNRFWFAGASGWVLDAGPFVAALEYATGMSSVVVGKPSRSFFRLALAHLRLPAHDVLVVGDDVVADIGGGRQAGCRTALVRTGIFRGGRLGRELVRPDLIIDSVARLLPPAARRGRTGRSHHSPRGSR